MTATAPIFDPPPETAAAILADLCDPLRSLHDIADTYATTIPALSIWMFRPDIRTQLHAVESAQAMHARLAAGASLPTAIDAVTRAVDDYLFEVARLPWHPAQATPAGLEQRRRARQTAQKGAWLLLRFARLTPLSIRARSVSEGPLSPPSDNIQSVSEEQPPVAPTPPPACVDNPTPSRPDALTPSLTPSPALEGARTSPVAQPIPIAAREPAAGRPFSSPAPETANPNAPTTHHEPHPSPASHPSHPAPALRTAPDTS